MNDLYAPDKSRDTTLGGGRIRSIDTVANVLLTNADKLQSVPMSNTQYSHTLSKRGNGQHRIQGQPAYVHSECGAAQRGKSGREVGRRLLRGRYYPPIIVAYGSQILLFSFDLLFDLAVLDIDF